MTLKKIGLLLAPALLLSVTALWLFSVMVEHSVIRDAERQSLEWAQYAGQRLDRIEDLAEGARPTPAEQRIIADMETFGHVFRFKLFHPSGALSFVSEDPLAEGPDLGDHNATAAAVIETLRPYTVVADGAGKQDRPDLYSETYLPIIKDGRVVAIVEVYLDQTDTRTAIRADYAAFGIAILVLILLGLAGPVAALVVVLRRLREKNLLLDIERDRAVAADRSKSEFLANISHELRTPLNGICGLSELLETQELDEEGREFLDVVQSSGNQMLILVNSLLDMSKIESGEMKLDRLPFDPSAILTEVGVLMALAAREKGIELDLGQPSTPLPKLLGDEHALRQICLNLLGNAIKFTEKGSVRVALELDGESGQDILTLTVSDTGIGIADADRARIFDRFVQTREGQNIGAAGTGLGLPIVRSVVEMMNGSVTVDSTLGEGSTFTVRIPAEIAENYSERLVA